MSESFNPQPDGDLSPEANTRILTFPELPEPEDVRFSPERAEIPPEALRKNQKMLDHVFGVGHFDLEEEYEAGNIPGLSKEQLEIIASQKEDERLSELIVIPGGVSREEIVTAINTKNKEEFGQNIWCSNGQDIESLKTYIADTQAAKENPRPNTFYVLAVNPKKETIDAHPEMAGDKMDLSAQLALLKRKQKANPALNLYGMTLPEAMLLDAFFVSSSEDPKKPEHADDSSRKWSYNRCLEEVFLDEDYNPVRALDLARDLDWFAAHSGLLVYSDSFADSSIGARLCAVSLPDSFLPSTFVIPERREAARARINQVFGKAISTVLPDSNSWARSYFLLMRVDKNGRCVMDQVEEYLNQYRGNKEECQRQQLAAAQKYFPGEFLVRPASASQEEGRGSLVSPVSPDKLDSIDTANLVKPVDEPKETAEE